ncbi:MAG: FixH family protein [Armatimonadota bacterium]
MRYVNIVALAATAILAGAAFAAPMKVRTAGTKSQSILMCEECQAKMSCAQVGDYLIGLNVDLENPKLGAGKIVAHVQDKQKQPVTNAKVTVALSMPDHKHGGKPITLKHESHGKYVAKSNRLGMSGNYRAEVAVKTSGGETVKQVFSFTK